MERIALQNCCGINKIFLPKENSSLITEISFTKGDDMILSLEKLLTQDQISTIYFKTHEDLLKTLNKNIFCQENLSFINEFLENDENLNKNMRFWDELIEKEAKDFPEKQKASSKFEKKFRKVCANPKNHENILTFFRETQEKDRIFAETYEKEVKKQEFLHSEEMRAICERVPQPKQSEIENIINTHLNSLETIENSFVIEFYRQESHKRQEFRKFISEINEKQEKISMNIGENNNMFGNKSTNKSKTSNNSTTNVENCPNFNRILSENSKKKNEDFATKYRKIAKPAKNSKKFHLQLCLGLQKKYHFCIGIQEKSLEDLLYMTEKKLVKFLERSSDEISNFIYGIPQKALISLFSSQKIEENMKLESKFRFKSELVFPNYCTQKENILNKLQKNEKFTICNGNFFVTKHSNFKIHTLFSVIYESCADFHSDLLVDWFGKIVSFCNENQINTIYIPLELFNIKNFANNFSNIKTFGDLLEKLIKMVKKEINNFSMEYAANQFLQKIIIVIPNKTDNNMNFFERAKEILKNNFE